MEINGWWKSQNLAWKKRPNWICVLILPRNMILFYNSNKITEHIQAVWYELAQLNKTVSTTISVFKYLALDVTIRSEDRCKLVKLNYCKNFKGSMNGWTQCIYHFRQRFLLCSFSFSDIFILVLWIIIQLFIYERNRIIYIIKNDELFYEYVFLYIQL